MDITGNFREGSERRAGEKAIIVSGKKIYISYYKHTITPPPYTHIMLLEI